MIFLGGEKNFGSKPTFWDNNRIFRVKSDNMKTGLSVLFVLLSSVFYAQGYSKCKVFTDREGLERLNKLGIPTDHGVVKQNTYFISDFSGREIETMKAQGFQVEILIEDVVSFYKKRSRDQKVTRNASCTQQSSGFDPGVPEHFGPGSMGGYFTYQEFLSELDEMQALYPDLITVKAPIDTFLTHEGRPLYWVRISDFADTDEPEPEVLYTAIHHAREPASLSSTIFYMWYLLENYASDPEIQYLVNETELYFIPMINPDGYMENQASEPDGGGMWRKNKRDNGDGSYGVDLNRNYSYEWGTTGISFDTDTDVYPGTGPFSEPETQAVKWFCENRDFHFAFNAHTYGNLLLFPIGSTVDEFAEDHDYLQTLGSHMVQYSHFSARKSSDLYPASGGSDDYMYTAEPNKPEIFAYTPEIGSDTDGFWPAEADIIPICQGMVFTNLVLAHVVHNYWLVRETDPAALTDISGDFHFTVNRLGIMDAPVTVSIEPLTGIANVGAAALFSSGQNVPADGSISYNLLPGIQDGDEVRYVLLSDFGDYIRRDTVVKTFGSPAVQVFDQAANSGNWTGSWSVTASQYYSPAYSFTDSPGDDYEDFHTGVYTFAQEIDLTHATRAKIEFYARWAIEDNYDYARLEVSTDGGNTWIGQCGKYTNAGVGGNGGVQPAGEPVYDGFQPDWVPEEISLSDYLGETIRIRFILESDMAVREDGFYFDDFKVLYDVDNAGLEAGEPNVYKVFPNPANASLTISGPKAFEQADMRILDLQGKTLVSGTVSSKLKNHRLEVSNLPPGIYFLEISENGQLYRTKFSLVR